MSRATVEDGARMAARRVKFIANSFYGQWEGDGTREWYVVYSYGGHWPMFVWDERWFEISERYSATTSRHQNACRAEIGAGYTTKMEPRVMRLLAARGLPGLLLDMPAAA